MTRVAQFAWFSLILLAVDARRVMDQLDHRGAWVEEDRLREYGDDDPTTHIITTTTFVAHVETLCKFLEALK